VTLLYQYQRDVARVDGQEFLIAEPFDGLVAISIIESAIAEAMTGLNRDQIEFFKHVSKESESREKKKWTYKELQGLYSDCFGEKIGRSTIQRRYVDPLVEVGAFGRDDEPKAHKMWVSSPIQTSNLSNLEEMRSKLSDLENGEEYLRNQFLAANRAWGENPGSDLEIDVEGAKEGVAYKDVLSVLRGRFGSLGGGEAVFEESERLEGSKGKKEDGEKVVSIEDLGGLDKCDLCQEEFGIPEESAREATHEIELEDGTTVDVCDRCWEERGHG